MNLTPSDFSPENLEFREKVLKTGIDALEYLQRDQISPKDLTNFVVGRLKINFKYLNAISSVLTGGIPCKSVQRSELEAALRTVEELEKSSGSVEVSQHEGATAQPQESNRIMDRASLRKAILDKVNQEHVMRLDYLISLFKEDGQRIGFDFAAYIRNGAYQLRELVYDSTVDLVASPPYKTDYASLYQAISETQRRQPFPLQELLVRLSLPEKQCLSKIKNGEIGDFVVLYDDPCVVISLSFLQTRVQANPEVPNAVCNVVRWGGRRIRTVDVLKQVFPSISDDPNLFGRLNPEGAISVAKTILWASGAGEFSTLANGEWEVLEKAP